MTQGRTALFVTGTALIVVAGLVLYFAPYTIPELTGPFSSHEIVDPATPDLAAGHMAGQRLFFRLRKMEAQPGRNLGRDAVLYV